MGLWLGRAQIVIILGLHLSTSFCTVTAASVSVLAPTSGPSNNLSSLYGCSTATSRPKDYPTPEAFEYVSTKVFAAMPGALRIWSSQNIQYNGSAPQCAFMQDRGHINPVAYSSLTAPRDANQLEAELLSECVLWDECCTGNRTEAKLQYFGFQGTRDYLAQISSPEFKTNVTTDCPWGSSLCTPRLLEMHAKLTKWRFTEECDSFNREFPLGRSFAPARCCDLGYVEAGNVDLYYWPEPDADTSCLDVVGGEVFPIDHRATRKDENQAYWGCVTTDGSGGSTTVTTALLQTVPNLNVTFKNYVTYPSGATCPETVSLSWRSAPQTVVSNGYASLAGSMLDSSTRLIALPSQSKGTGPSTVVSGDFTFTSPFIYAHITSIRASDACSFTLIPSKMFTFTPGELSTLAGYSSSVFCGGVSTTYSLRTSSFNFRDLPCPAAPLEGVEFYRPYPGEPYRPQLAAPEQLKNLNDWFKRLEYRAFTGFDPPRALASATLMVAGEANTQSTGAVPAATLVSTTPTATPKPPTDRQARTLLSILSKTQKPEDSLRTLGVFGFVAAKPSVTQASVSSPGGNDAGDVQRAGIGDQAGNGRAVKAGSGKSQPNNVDQGPDAQSASPQVQPTQSLDNSSPLPAAQPGSNSVAAHDVGLTDSVFQAKAADQAGKQNAAATESGGQLIGVPKAGAVQAGSTIPSPVVQPHVNGNGDVKSPPPQLEDQAPGQNSEPAKDANEVPVPASPASDQTSNEASQAKPAAGGANVAAPVSPLSGASDPQGGQGSSGTLPESLAVEGTGKNGSPSRVYGPSSPAGSPGDAGSPQFSGSSGSPGSTGFGDSSGPPGPSGDPASGAGASQTEHNESPTVSSAQGGAAQQAQMPGDGQQRVQDSTADIQEPSSSSESLLSPVSGSHGAGLPPGREGNAAIFNDLLNGSHDSGDSRALGSEGLFEANNGPDESRAGGGSSDNHDGERKSGKGDVGIPADGSRAPSSAIDRDSSGQIVPSQSRSGNEAERLLMSHTQASDTVSTAAPVVTINGHKIQPLTGAISIEGQKLVVGAPAITASNSDVVSLAQSSLVVGSSTIVRDNVGSAMSSIATSSALGVPTIVSTRAQTLGRPFTNTSQGSESGATRAIASAANPLAAVAIAALTLVFAFEVF